MKVVPITLEEIKMLHMNREPDAILNFQNKLISISYFNF